MMDLQKRVKAFSKLGNFLRAHLDGKVVPGLEEFHAELNTIIAKSFHYNGWFTQKSMETALKGIGLMLEEGQLARFAQQVIPARERKVAVIMAGNIPAVGFHDFLCVLISGHTLLARTSCGDPFLIPFFTSFLIHEEPAFKDKVEFAVGKLSGFDAVIATGNDNSARYFEYYFGKYPHIIRRNRNSAAILTGAETEEELNLLGSDIFTFFGLGCRNVSKLYIPAEYDFTAFFKAAFNYAGILENKKYANNYEYHRALFLLEKINFLDNNFMILKEDANLSSPVSVLHYEFYRSTEQLKESILKNENRIQCLVGRDFPGLDLVNFGSAQFPELSDFADKINTIEFLRSIG